MRATLIDLDIFGAATRIESALRPRHLLNGAENVLRPGRDLHAGGLQRLILLAFAAASRGPLASRTSED